MAHCDKATTVSICVLLYPCDKADHSTYGLIVFLVFLYCFGHPLQVSYTYSKEVSGHGSIAPHYFKFHGIRNGIDSDIWDPYNDNFIPVR